ncbi:MAG: hypothetical protein ABII00_18835 [Elusimicrobiota bacterium]
MRVLTPLTPLLLCLALLCAPLRADEPDKPPPQVPAPVEPAPAPDKPAPPKPAPDEPVPQPGVPTIDDLLAELKKAEKDKRETVQVDGDLAALLERHGFSADENGAVTHRESAVQISRAMLRHADIDFNDEGVLVYAKTELPVRKKHIPDILNGLLKFAKVARHAPAEVGKVLQAWGVPPAFDGYHLINPDGTATPYGLMLYEGLREDPGALRRLNTQRFGQSLHRFEQAYSQAFHNHTPQAAISLLDNAWGKLRSGNISKEGGSALDLRPYADIGTQLGEYRGRLQSEVAAAEKEGDLRRQGELTEYIATLNVLEKMQYHQEMRLPTAVPAPGSQSPVEASIWAEDRSRGPGTGCFPAFWTRWIRSAKRSAWARWTPGRKRRSSRPSPWATPCGAWAPMSSGARGSPARASRSG